MVPLVYFVSRGHVLFFLWSCTLFSFICATARLRWYDMYDVYDKKEKQCNLIAHQQRWTTLHRSSKETCLLLHTTMYLYQILPTSIYKFLSNNYQSFLLHSYTIRTNEHYDMENIYFAFVIGISLGLILVTLLDFFPGETKKFLLLVSLIMVS